MPNVIQLNHAFQHLTFDGKYTADFHSKVEKRAESKNAKDMQTVRGLATPETCFRNLAFEPCMTLPESAHERTAVGNVAARVGKSERMHKVIYAALLITDGPGNLMRDIFKPIMSSQRTTAATDRRIR